MKRTALALITFCICFACTAPAFAADKYVKITTSFANVYEYLDPKSNVIQQAKKGSCFKLVYEGTSWYQVTVKSKVGWIDKREGKLVDNPNYILGAFTPLNILVILILVAATIGGVFYYIKKQQQHDEE